MTQRKRHTFSKCVVILILCVGLILTATCIKAWWSTNHVDGYSLTALLAFWGGELMLLCLKRVLGDKTPSQPIMKPVNADKESGSI